MPRQAGQIIERTRARGRYFAIRFSAYGQRRYVTLGTAAEGWTRARAEVELENVLADVRRGIWRLPDPEPEPEAPTAEPTFHEFASEWFDAHRGEWSENTRQDYEWQLTCHLLPFFARHRLSRITVAEVDRYRRTKVAEGRLSATSINKTLTRLGQILDVADEYELIARNPVRVNPRNRKLKASVPPRVYLDRADHVVALLDAAGELDAEARPDRQGVGRRAILATLVFAGLRIGELCALRWRDVDLAGGRLRVAKAKTAAGARYVELLAVLREELAVRKAGMLRAGASDYVFATRKGNSRTKDNVRERVLRPAVVRANQRLAEHDLAPLPEGLTLHGLRHTFASIIVALGEDPGHVMDQVGHTDPAFTLRVYRHAMRRDDGEKDRLRALVEGEFRAPAGTSGDFGAIRAPSAAEAEDAKTASEPDFPITRPAGFEPAASRSGGGRSIH